MRTPHALELIVFIKTLFGLDDLFSLAARLEEQRC
jgi:hypothetical protein